MVRGRLAYWLHPSPLNPAAPSTGGARHLTETSLASQRRFTGRIGRASLSGRLERTTVVATRAITHCATVRTATRAVCVEQPGEFSLTPASAPKRRPQRSPCHAGSHERHFDCSLANEVRVEAADEQRGNCDQAHPQRRRCAPRRPTHAQPGGNKADKDPRDSRRPPSEVGASPTAAPVREPAPATSQGHASLPTARVPQDPSEDLPGNGALNGLAPPPRFPSVSRNSGSHGSMSRSRSRSSQFGLCWLMLNVSDCP